jgi:hypothetical protein
MVMTRTMESISHEIYAGRAGGVMLALAELIIQSKRVALLEVKKAMCQVLQGGFMGRGIKIA